ncbi:MAG: GFA family protein [Xanthomonadales bacterium]|nr:GFA family protein [Xanthomonadales bacterium]
MSEAKTASGSCFCKAVQFHFTLPSKWCAHCHCSMCRKVHGAGYVTWVGFESDRFTLDSGQQHLKWFESSPGASRGFCSHCGSSMFFRSQRWAGELHVALGCMDDPVGRTPQAHAFHDSHVNWMPLDDALKVFNG